MADAVHLEVVESILEVGLLHVCLQSCKGSGSCATGGGAASLTLTLYFTNDAIRIDTDVLIEDDDDIAFSWYVAAKCTPPSLAGEGKAGETTKRENTAPSLLEEHRDGFFRVVAIDLVWARTVTVESIIAVKVVLN